MKNGKLIEQEMPRAAKDLFRRQLAMKNQTSTKKRSQKKKKQGYLLFAVTLISKSIWDEKNDEQRRVVSLMMCLCIKFNTGKQTHHPSR